MSVEWPETREPTSHETIEGEHVTRVAAAHGFRSIAPLWDHKENATLRAARHTPHVLAPGDRVYVPTVKHREVERPTEQRHRFRATLAPLHLRVARLHYDGTPITEAPSAVTRDGAVATFTTQQGVVNIPIDATNTRCVLTTGTNAIVAMIGFLQPVSTVPGFRERLNNLGYRAGKAITARDLDLRSAVEEFQCDHGLAVDGTCGDATQRQLVHVHGC